LVDADPNGSGLQFHIEAAQPAYEFAEPRP
jgi:hypothetical protein